MIVEIYCTRPCPSDTQLHLIDCHPDTLAVIMCQRNEHVVVIFDIPFSRFEQLHLWENTECQGGE